MMSFSMGEEPRGGSEVVESVRLLSRFANPLRLGVRLLRRDFIAGRFRTIFANVDSKVV